MPPTPRLPELRAQIAANLQLVDILSINRTEALRLYATGAVEDALLAAHADGARIVVLRMGGEGAVAYDGVQFVHIPAAPAVVVDVTGGGNAFSGGFLAGYCESGGDLVTAGRCAAVSAAYAIEQYGPPADLGAVVQARAKAAGGCFAIAEAVPPLGVDHTAQTFALRQESRDTSCPTVAVSVPCANRSTACPT